MNVEYRATTHWRNGIPLPLGWPALWEYHNGGPFSFLEERMENPDADDLVATPICLPRALRDELDSLARKNGLLRGRSALVRNAVRESLDRHTLQLRSQVQESEAA